MNRSLNEIEAMSKTASRGAGYAWGHAEEAGKAARWLCAHGLDGCDVLARWLGVLEIAELVTAAPDTTSDRWCAARDPMCPILTGSALSDRAYRLAIADITLERVACPLLLLPFAAGAARQLHCVVTLRWSGVTATSDGEEAEVCGELAAVNVGSAARVVARGKGRLTQPLARRARGTPGTESWRRLEGLARRTYAPATEASRLLGAGAGTRDED